MNNQKNRISRKTRIISSTKKEAIDIAELILKSGGIISFPTDTVYGIASLANDSKGIKRLFQVKGRSFNKAIAVLIGDYSQLPMITPSIGELGCVLSRHFWPGALTLVVTKNPALPRILSPLPTIGVRMPDHPFTRALIKQTGPLATTSANISGNQNTLTAQEVDEQLGGKIDLIIDGGKTPGTIPSTVVDCTGIQPAILRIGSITEEKIYQVLQAQN